MKLSVMYIALFFLTKEKKKIPGPYIQDISGFGMPTDLHMSHNSSTFMSY